MQKQHLQKKSEKLVFACKAQVRGRNPYERIVFELPRGLRAEFLNSFGKSHQVRITVEDVAATDGS